MSVNGWVDNKVCRTCRVEYYSAIRRNGLLRRATTWRNQKIIILSERSQTKKFHTVWFHLYNTLENLIYSDRKQISGYLGIGGVGRVGRRNGKKEENPFEGNSVFFLYLDYADGFMVRYIYVYMANFIKLYTLSMCSLLYFSYFSLVTEWMNLLFSRKEGKHLLIPIVGSA